MIGVIPKRIEAKKDVSGKAKHQSAEGDFPKKKANKHAKQGIEAQNAAMKGVQKHGIAKGEENEKDKIAHKYGKEDCPFPFSL